MIMQVGKSSHTPLSFPHLVFQQQPKIYYNRGFIWYFDILQIKIRKVSQAFVFSLHYSEADSVINQDDEEDLKIQSPLSFRQFVNWTGQKSLSPENVLAQEG